MIGQSKISSFFRAVTVRSGTKRPRIDNSTEPELNQGASAPSKKLKSIENVDDPKLTENGTTLGPEQEKTGHQQTKSPERLHSKQGTLTPTGVVAGAPKGMGETWARALSAEFKKSYFKDLQLFVEKERQTKTIYPPADQVYSWTQLCPIHDVPLLCSQVIPTAFRPISRTFQTAQVKVVILGQDPYHGPGQAHGLCFSVKKGIRPPPSLDNMFKELSTDIEGFQVPSHGDLTGWAKQGVLLLNAVLTVRAHQANSHKDKGWEKFTDAVIAWLNKHSDDVVFLLWGSYAQKKGSIINTKRHHVLKCVHPSPLSSYRGFFGCKHFSKANSILKKVGKKPIDWGKLDGE